MIDIMDRLVADVEHAQANPEGIEVEVSTTDPYVAAKVAPMLAARLYPGRRFGEILHTEDGEDTIRVVVRDLGIPGLTTNGAHPSAYGAGR